ncbi:MAG: aminoacyl-tRNA hydrolase [Alphaproteobacteria bacterium]|nr:aminoacyl-tRNA hydrolase [Alphaproteobacteria bacterium]
MRLFVGLGNPGQKYRNNRHNIGFMAMDAIVHRHNFSGWSKKFQGEISDGTLEGEKVLLLKPQTFMNLSGQSVQAAAAFYKIKPQDIVVFHDELDLAPGKIRTKKGGGAAGHNGLRSIDDHLGQDYWRVRLGIGHPGNRELVTGYVLNDFSKAEQADWLEPLLDAMAGNAARLAKGDTDGFMSKVAQAIQPPEENGHKKTDNAKKEQGNGV